MFRYVFEEQDFAQWYQCICEPANISVPASVQSVSIEDSLPRMRNTEDSTLCLDPDVHDILTYTMYANSKG